MSSVERYVQITVNRMAAWAPFSDRVMKVDVNAISIYTYVDQSAIALVAIGATGFETSLSNSC